MCCTAEGVKRAEVSVQGGTPVEQHRKRGNK
jgi:hypothetical protein